MHLPYTLPVLGGAVVASFIYKGVEWYIWRRHFAAEVRRLGCKEPLRKTYKLPFGIDDYIRGIKKYHEKQIPVSLVEDFKEVGVKTLSFTVLGTRIVITADPRNIQTILATKFKDYGVSIIRRERFLPMLGDGIFTSDGKQWEHSRAMLRPQFARAQISDLDLEERHTRNLMRAIPPSEDGWTSPTDLQVLFFRLTFDAATEFLFGQSADSQIAALEPEISKTSDGLLSGLAEDFEYAQVQVDRRINVLGLFWLPDGPKFNRACKHFHDFIDSYVASALDRKADRQKAGSDGTKKYSFLEALAEETQDPIELRSQLSHLLLAGRDTTASLLSWLFYHLVRHPDIYKRLRETVIASFGSYEEPQDISFSSLMGCSYLQYCLNETLRLNPVLPMNARMAERDTTLPFGGGSDEASPVFIAKGQMVAYSVHVMHRQPEFWGYDAEEFRPERWQGRKHGWDYLPFNGGPRICIGQQFALTEASYVAVRLLQRFDAIENLDKDPIMRYELRLTSSSGTGVQVRLHDASASAKT